jgi:hypothetical protein
MHISGVSKETVIATVFFFAPTNMVTLLNFQSFIVSLPFLQSNWDPRNVGTLSI